MRCKNCGALIKKSVWRCIECGQKLGTLPILLHNLKRLDVFFVSLSLSIMLLMVLTQIFLRNFFQTGIAGGDELVRHMVLWVAYLGAALAAKDGTHIRIDVADKILPEKIKPWIQAIVTLFSIFICGILIYASYQFVLMELESQTHIAFLDLPVWGFELIIPIGYLIIAVRLGINGYTQLMKGSAK